MAKDEILKNGRVARRAAGAAAEGAPQDRLGRDICADLDAAERREWMVANGIGGYAAGAVAGLPTRGYHGLLVAALDPPLGRTLKLVLALETVEVGGDAVELGTVRWRGGEVSPQGFTRLEAFRLEGTIPVWRYATARFVLEKRIWMDDRANVTRIAYANLWSEAPLSLSVKLVTDHRDYHGRTFAGEAPEVRAEDGALIVASPDGETALHVVMEGARAEAAGVWWRGFDLARERDRGLTDSEDHLHAGTLRAELASGATVQLVAAVGAAAAADAGALDARRRRDGELLALWRERRGRKAPEAPDWVARLVLAADQFVVDRARRDGTPGKSVIAGYPWFSDWGRDTMISLPGLCLETGRPEIARAILLAFAEAMDGGMIPNRYPDVGETPEYNTVDATFWFVEAIRAHVEATGDQELLATLWPRLEEIVAAHVEGTRYGIRVDEGDGLVRAGEPGVQLTWMDAKVGDWVVTPRIGKPVEVNALWLSALRFLADAARMLKKPPDRYEALFERAAIGFRRFWNPERGFLFDVLDGPDGHEAALRPNQIFAASLPVRTLPQDQLEAVVRACETALLTPAGLRSLARDESGYRPRYGGDQTARDSAYHQGTVWAWLIGPYVEAVLNVFGDAERARRALRPFADQLRIEGLGSVNEIFEADPPHAPRGCAAQAWSVAELLRAWSLLDRFERGVAAPAKAKRKAKARGDSDRRRQPA